MKLRPYVLVAASLAIVALWPTWPPLVRVWLDSDSYQHGPLVALITLIWLVRASGRLPSREAPPRGAAWQPAVLLVLALVAWLLAYKANVELGKQLVAPVIIGLAIATAAGWRAAAAVEAPILYFYFAIPVWSLLIPLLQWMTVCVAQGVLGMAGVPVRIDGVLITIPEGSFIVLEACSGERYLIVALAAAALIAAIESMRRPRVVLYMALTAGIAIFANWARVVAIIVAGHVTNMTSYLVAREHVSFGWAIFLVLILIVPPLGRRLSRGQAEKAAHESGSADRGNPPRLAVATALLCIPALALLWLSDPRMATSAVASIALPKAGTGWRGPVAPSQRWAPTFLGASRQKLAAFESDDGTLVETYSAVYGTQQPGAKLIYYSNRLTGKGWLTLSEFSSHRTLSGRSVTVRTLLTQAPGGKRWLIDYYYVVDDVHVTRDWGAQLLYGLLSWTQPTPSAVIAAASECGSSCDGADRALANYWASTAS
jgi:EpsI family protein